MQKSLILCFSVGKLPKNPLKLPQNYPILHPTQVNINYLANSIEKFPTFTFISLQIPNLSQLNRRNCTIFILFIILWKYKMSLLCLCLVPSLVSIPVSVVECLTPRRTNFSRSNTGSRIIVNRESTKWYKNNFNFSWSIASSQENFLLFESSFALSAFLNV